MSNQGQDKKDDKPVFDFTNLKFNFGDSGFKFEPQSDQLLSAISTKLEGLIGSSSGYLETLPISIQARIKALQRLQDQHSAIDEELSREIRLLEIKYLERHKPLWDQRADIIKGKVEPSKEDFTAVEPKIEEIKEGKESENTSTTTPSSETEEKGIPEFWLRALKNHPCFEEAITKNDEEALKYLEDVRFEYLTDEPDSFKLIFTFANDNPFLESTVLMKTYHMENDKESEDVICDTIDATELVWKNGKNLLEGCTGVLGEEDGSFFLFFTPPDVPEEGEPSPEIAQHMAIDFEMAVELKDKIITNAIGWFTGEAEVEDEAANGIYFDGEDEEDYDSEEDEDWVPQKETAAPKKRGKDKKKNQGKGTNTKQQQGDNTKEDKDDAPAPECKQQ